MPHASDALRQGAMVPDALASAVVLDRSGEPRVLCDFWRESPCVVVFLRHFGCSGCAENVTAIAPRLLELHALGVRAVFVGNGEPRYIDAFVERNALGDKKVTLVTDPTLAAFGAAHLSRSVWATLGPRALVEKVRGLAAGFSSSGVQGDAFQQGGAFVVDRGGRIVFAHANARFADHASPSDLVESALALVARKNAAIAT